MQSVIFNEKRWQELFIKKRWPWHLAFWMVYLLTQSRSYYLTVTGYEKIFLYFMFCREALFVLFTYAVIYWYRKTFARGKMVAFFLVGTGLCLIYLFVRIQLQLVFLGHTEDFKKASVYELFINGLVPVLLYLPFLTMCKYFKDNHIKQYYETERKQQHLKAELDNLKAQIAPHFLFNTMNNFYGLAVEKSDKLPGLMLQLSDLLRYSLYETQKSFVPLEKEITALKNYIALEKIRTEETLYVQFDEDYAAHHDLFIAPLVLIIFVENAFKHVKKVAHEHSGISIHCATVENEFIFTCCNDYDGEKGKTSNAGIGLQNVKRRLEAIYPDRHTLIFSTANNVYTVTLKLNLNTTGYDQ